MCLWLLLWLHHRRSHEDMSTRMVEYIVDEHNVEIDAEMLKKVKVYTFKL